MRSTQMIQKILDMFLLSECGCGMLKAIQMRKLTSTFEPFERILNTPEDYNIAF